LSSDQQTTTRARLYFIDLLRGWAVFVMIETHVLNALLLPPLKDQSLFKIITFINGLVAPAFLFCAGLALAITFQRKWNDFINLKAPLWKYLFRLLFILVIGYSLHLPFFSLRKMMGLRDTQLWMSFSQVDILQTIVVSLLLLIIILLLVRKHLWFIFTATILMIAFVYSAPVVREIDYSSLPIWLRPYLTQHYKSQFPLFPWAAFLISGAILGLWYLYERERSSEKKIMQQILTLAAVGIALSLTSEMLPFTVYPVHNFWLASPGFFFVRLGLVVAALVGLWYYIKDKQVSSRAFFILLGQESLLIYVVHLLIVYGYTYRWSFIRLFGSTLNYSECIVIFLALSILMYALGYTWHWLKSRNKRFALTIEVVTLSIIVIIFILKTD